MKKKFGIVLSALVSASSVLAAPAPAKAAAPTVKAGPCEGMPTIETNACWNKEFDIAESGLKEKFTIAIDRFKAAKKDALADQLKKSHYDWVVARTSHCDFMEKATAGTPAEAGSKARCKYQLTQDRMNTLAALIAQMSS
ncbi:MAG: lysozyme inhibitor LprI family protein [Myxococcaceae bacterium]|nr:lysozyme inhibitor LprI family protein [Myxococcaceae bacterium]